MVVQFSPAYDQVRDSTHAEFLSWRIALPLIANVSVGLWIVVGKAVLLLVP